jgi:shikimate kinase
VNWDYLNASGITVGLSAPVDVLAERIGRNQDRPLMANLSHEERIQKIEDMLRIRQPYYERADFHFKSSNELSVPDFVNHIFETLLEKL